MLAWGFEPALPPFTDSLGEKWDGGGKASFSPFGFFSPALERGAGVEASDGFSRNPPGGFDGEFPPPPPPRRSGLEIIVIQ